MKTTIKKLVLFPLLATLATAPICARAHAEPWFTLGLGWWIIPVAVGGVALYEIGRAQGDGESHNVDYGPETAPVATHDTAPAPQGGYVQMRTVTIAPAPTPIYGEPATYYQAQYGYVLRTPQ